jgi:hypothetical protein
VLSGTSNASTINSGNLAALMAAKASAANNHAAGRARCGRSSLRPVAISSLAAAA